MRRSIIKKTLAFLATVLILTASLPFYVFAYSSTDSRVDSWSAASDGQNVIITFSGVATPWYNQFDGKVSGGVNADLQFIYNSGTSSVKSNWADIPGSQMNFNVDGNGAYTAQVSIPLSYFGNGDFNLMLFGTTVASNDILGSSPVDPDDPSGPDEPDDPKPPKNPPSGERVTGRIVVDGSLNDWANVNEYPSDINSDGIDIDGWKVTMDEYGNLYFCAWGTADTEWASPQWKSVNVTQDGRYDGNIQIGNIPGLGGQLSIINGANGNTPGPLYVEAMIPASFLTDPNFVFSFGNIDIPASSIQVVDGNEVDDKPDDPVYDGIVIDGEYHDWDAVTKYPASDAQYGHENLDSVSMVFDGDMVYIYIKEAQGGDAAHAGLQHNGHFVITTDTGKTLLIQLNDDGTVSGIDGATSAHVGTEWEIAIPADRLPEYLESLSFGLYEEEPFVKDVVNLSGEGSGGTFDGIIYDGQYHDWDYYPHSQLDYTGNKGYDASGALWFDGDHTLFGHFYTDEPGGGIYDLTHGITFRFNGGDYTFWPRALGGTYEDTDWNPTFDDLPDGTYEYLLANNSGWSNWGGNDVYGKMYVTKKGDFVQCEFYLDLSMIAELFGCDADDFKMIEAQFGELGTEWVRMAGTSSGAWLGVAVCVASVLTVLLIKKKRGKTSVE